MYCRNCGKQIPDQAVVCINCGIPPRKGKSYCQNCGAASNPLAEICTGCGVRLSGEGKDWLTTLLLCIFLGCLGVHRFYTGSIAIGVVQLLTGGGCGIWYLIDIILIATGSYKDAEGNFLVKR